MSIDITSARGSNISTLRIQLATRFLAHRENLVTEALSYILNRSLSASKRHHSLPGRCGANLPLPFTFATQVPDENRVIPAPLAHFGNLLSLFPIAETGALIYETGTLFMVPARSHWGEHGPVQQGSERALTLRIQPMRTGGPAL